MNLQEYSKEINGCLTHEESFDKFIALQDLAQTTQSDTSIPDSIRDRVLKKIGQFQMAVAEVCEKDLEQLKEDEMREVEIEDEFMEFN